VIEPLRFSFTVECSRQHAFDVWTQRTTSWWPKDHTISNDSNARVTIEPFVGGRILESAPGGSEHEWGEIVEWQPPQRFAYHWYITSDASDATFVEIEFQDIDAGTRIDINHSGWERLGRGVEMRQLNQGGWDAIIPHFVDACRSAGI